MRAKSRLSRFPRRRRAINRRAVRGHPHGYWHPSSAVDLGRWAVREVAAVFAVPESLLLAQLKRQRPAR